MYLYIFLCALAHSAFGGGRIIGGTTVDIKNHPYQAALLQRIHNYDYFRCGAIIISAKHLLTAAHCKKTHTKSYRIVIGQYKVPKYDQNDFLRNKTYKVQKFVLHPEYNESTFPMHDNDIAVITIAGTLKLDGKYSDPIDLALHPTPPGIIAEVSGYGYTQRIVKPEPNHRTKQFLLLKAAPVPTVEHASCAKYFKLHHKNLHITKNMICAGYPCSNDACQGDSGGPLVSDNRLIGIVSYGWGCGGTSPGVYTDVSKYTNFISHETKGLVGRTPSPTSL